MSELYITHYIRCYMTPNDLRRIADKMEKAWAERKAGDSMDVWTVPGENVEIHFVIDQGEMPKMP
jgi:hypothetical protein